MKNLFFPLMLFISFLISCNTSPKEKKGEAPPPKKESSSSSLNLGEMRILGAY